MKNYILIIFILITGHFYSNTFFVLNNNDSGLGSLRQAILDANSNSGFPHLISFANFSGNTEIRLQANSLPIITNPTIIDATTHPSYINTPIISINGMNLIIGTSDFYYGEYNNLKVFRIGSTAHGSAIKGFEFYDVEDPSNLANNPLIFAIEIDKANNINISYNEFRDLNTCINVINSLNSIIQNNNSSLVTNFFYSSLSCENTIVQNNYLNDTRGVAIRLRGSGLTVKNNEIKNSLEPYGVLIQNVHSYWGIGSNNIVKENLFENMIIGVGVQKFHSASVVDPNGNVIAYSNSNNGSPIYNTIEKNIFKNISSKAIRLFYDVPLNTGNDGKPMPVINAINPQTGIINGIAEPNDKIELFASNSQQDALVFLGSTTANSFGIWNTQISGFINFTHITATATDKLNKNTPFNENTTELANILIPEFQCLGETCSTAIELTGNMQFDQFCGNYPCIANGLVWFIVNVDENGLNLSLDEITGPHNFSYGIATIGINGICDPNLNNNVIESGANVTSINYQFTNAGQYALVININNDCPIFSINVTEPFNQCESCIGSFAPIPGSKYVITAWTKEEGAANTKTSYTFPELFIHFTVPDPNNPNATIITTVGPFTPTGAIIDGWQRIESEFSIPLDAIDIEIELSSSSGNVLYDDIRMFPFNASMKTFVYDPVNMRLAAELDERHYSTFYEYDEEGKLVRIKKETEKGIMTIQETKSNATK